MASDEGSALITTADAAEVHPTVFVTVKLEVEAAANPEIVVLVPVPFMLPGLIVQLPDGSALSTTLPVTTAQVGCVMVPTAGADGVALIVNVPLVKVML